MDENLKISGYRYVMVTIKLCVSEFTYKMNFQGYNNLIVKIMNQLAK